VLVIQGLNLVRWVESVLPRRMGGKNKCHFVLICHASTFHRPEQNTGNIRVLSHRVTKLSAGEVKHFTASSLSVTNLPDKIVQVTCSYDRLCGLVVRVPGYTTEMYCASCEVRTEFIYVM
jgi:hypothetical protein